MSTPLSQSVRCPHCSAQIRVGSDWCTLCFTDLRPAPAPVAPATAPTATAPATVTLAPRSVATFDSTGDPESTAALAAPAAPASAVRGKHSRHAPVEEDGGAEIDVEALADRMLAELAANESRHALGQAAVLFDTDAKRTAVMIGGAVLAMLLIVLVATLIGKVF